VRTVPSGGLCAEVHGRQAARGERDRDERGRGHLAVSRTLAAPSDDADAAYKEEERDKSGCSNYSGYRAFVLKESGQAMPHSTTSRQETCE
jgi:hypothetical protein